MFCSTKCCDREAQIELKPDVWLCGLCAGRRVAELGDRRYDPRVLLHPPGERRPGVRQGTCDRYVSPYGS